MNKPHSTSKISNVHSNPDCLQKNPCKINNSEDRWKSSFKIRRILLQQRRKRLNSLEWRYPNNNKMNSKESLWLTLCHIECQHKWVNKMCQYSNDYQSKKLLLMMCSNKKICFHQKYVSNQNLWDVKKMLQVFYTKMLKEGNKSKNSTFKIF